jgi:hypothetical protein
MMSKRKIFFICSSILNNDLISREIVASSEDEAINFFKVDTGFDPKVIFGPFYKKKVVKIDNTQELKFSSDMKKAIYNDWNVTAFMLLEPKNCAFLVFNNRVDGKKMPAPQDNKIVLESELKVI